MKGHLIHLWEYTGWANGLVADALAALPEADSTTVTLFSHLITAEEIWLVRARRIVPGAEKIDPPNGAIWTSRSVANCRRESVASVEAWLAFLRSLGEINLKTPIEFEDLAGTPRRNSIKEIVTHVVNHGTYHRGQIAAQLRRTGSEPPATDYIVYTHENPK